MAHLDVARVRTRRKRYLDLHPEYLADTGLEEADPLLYDRLVRRFQTAGEREREGRARGYAASLEADLRRSEAKLGALKTPDLKTPVAYQRAADGSITAVERELGQRAQNKEDGLERWRSAMRLRFIEGNDSDFDYALLDNDDALDDRAEEERTQLEEYLGAEEEQFVGVGEPEAQTGVQDF